MHVGLFFGSYNPIHVGHLIIAEYMANYTGLDQLWLVISPHNPLKNKSELINMYDRLEMAKLATEDSEKIRISDIEFKLPQPSYTIDTLTHLKEQFPDRKLSLIMGSDNLKSFKKWKNYERILADHHIYVYPRPDSLSSELLSHPSVTLTQTPLMEISSTFIRKALKDKKSVRYLLPSEVLKFIESKNLYR